MVSNDDTLRALRAKLPPGNFRLVDNRIMVGDTSWIATVQPKTVVVLHPKQNKAKHRAFVTLLLEILNALNQPQGAPEPKPETPL